MQQTWIYYSILAGVMIGFADTLNKYLIDDDLDLLVMLLYKFIFAAIVTTGLIYFTMPPKDNKGIYKYKETSFGVNDTWRLLQLV